MEFVFGEPQLSRSQILRRGTRHEADAIAADAGFDARNQQRGRSESLTSFQAEPDSNEMVTRSGRSSTARRFLASLCCLVLLLFLVE